MLQTKVPKAIPVVATMTWRWRAIRHVLLAPQRTATRASRARLGAGTRMAFTVASAVLAATALEALAPRGAAVLALPGGSVSVAAATPTAVASARAGAGAGARQRSAAVADPVGPVVTGWGGLPVPHAMVRAPSAATHLPEAVLAEPWQLQCRCGTTHRMRLATPR